LLLEKLKNTMSLIDISLLVGILDDEMHNLVLTSVISPFDVAARRRGGRVNLLLSVLVAMQVGRGGAFQSLSLFGFLRV
jgi:hypothetical protein